MEPKCPKNLQAIQKMNFFEKNVPVNLVAPFGATDSSPTPLRAGVGMF
jgi:hypothetical protein